MEGRSEELERKLRFDNISLNFLTKLEKFKEISSVRFHTERGISADDVLQWEQMNNPYSLPSDLASFYSMFNGVEISWDVMLGEESVTVGDIKLHGLQSMKRTESSHLAAFVLESQVDVGDLALIYRTEPKSDSVSFDESVKTEIWFRDFSSEWHFVCSTFTQLLRLMVVHLGNRKSFIQSISLHSVMNIIVCMIGTILQLSQ